MLRRKDAICMLDNLGRYKETHSECVLRIDFPRQRWLRERASLLGYSKLPVLFLHYYYYYYYHHHYHHHNDINQYKVMIS